MKVAQKASAQKKKCLHILFTVISPKILILGKICIYVRDCGPAAQIFGKIRVCYFCIVEKNLKISEIFATFCNAMVLSLSSVCFLTFRTLRCFAIDEVFAVSINCRDFQPNYKQL